jgi:proteasome lid subunit RPN8/RPN11
MAAERLGLGLIGVFHSHPEHPNTPSETDRELAQPFFSYLITSVVGGLPTSDRAWRLKEDRSGFDEEAVAVIPQTD